MSRWLLAGPLHHGPAGPGCRSARTQPATGEGGGTMPAAGKRSGRSSRCASGRNRCRELSLPTGKTPNGGPARTPRRKPDQSAVQPPTPLGGEMLPLRDQLLRSVAQVYARPLNTRDHLPAEIIAFWRSLGHTAEILLEAGSSQPVNGVGRPAGIIRAAAIACSEPMGAASSLGSATATSGGPGSSWPCWPATGCRRPTKSGSGNTRPPLPIWLQRRRQPASQARSVRGAVRACLLHRAGVKPGRTPKGMPGPSSDSFTRNSIALPIRQASP